MVTSRRLRENDLQLLHVHILHDGHACNIIWSDQLTPICAHTLHTYIHTLHDGAGHASQFLVRFLHVQLNPWEQIVYTGLAEVCL